LSRYVVNYPRPGQFEVVDTYTRYTSGRFVDDFIVLVHYQSRTEAQSHADRLNKVEADSCRLIAELSQSVAANDRRVA
jgi:hypothetical protein